MNKLILAIVGLAFVSLSTVHAEGNCGGCTGKDKDKKEETKKEENKK